MSFVAALGYGQMEYLPQILANKRQTAEMYRTLFEEYDTIDFISERNNTAANYWLNAILLPNRKQRDEFLQFGHDRGVMVRPAWILMNKLPMYQGCSRDSLDNSEWLENRLVKLPSGYRE